MKILIVTDAWYPQVNGVVRTYEHLRDELGKLGHTVRIIGPADFPWTVPLPGYAEIRLALFPYARLKKIIGAFAPDHIHAATEGPLGWAARRYCRKHCLRFSTAYHTHFPDYVAKRIAWDLPLIYDGIHVLAKKYIRVFHAPSSCLMVSTDSLEKELKAHGFEMPMVKLSRGVSIDMFHPGEKTLFGNLKRPVALYVGRVAIEKNIEAFLRMDWPGSKVVVGDGPRRAQLSRRYPQAYFAGQKTGDDLAAHYRSADVFVFPSRTDTFGIVILEALASGIPVAGYNVRGPKDIITLPYLGVLDSDLSAAAKKALDCGAPELRASHVRDTYTWKHAAAQFEAAIHHENMVIGR